MWWTTKSWTWGSSATNHRSPRRAGARPDWRARETEEPSEYSTTTASSRARQTVIAVDREHVGRSAKQGPTKSAQTALRAQPRWTLWEALRTRVSRREDEAIRESGIVRARAGSRSAVMHASS